MALTSSRHITSHHGKAKTMSMGEHDGNHCCIHPESEGNADSAGELGGDGVVDGEPDWNVGNLDGLCNGLGFSICHSTASFLQGTEHCLRGRGFISEYLHWGGVLNVIW